MNMNSDHEASLNYATMGSAWLIKIADMLDEGLVEAIESEAEMSDNSAAELEAEDEAVSIYLRISDWRRMTNNARMLSDFLDGYCAAIKASKDTEG